MTARRRDEVKSNTAGLVRAHTTVILYVYSSSAIIAYISHSLPMHLPIPSHPSSILHHHPPSPHFRIRLSKLIHLSIHILINSPIRHPRYSLRARKLIHHYSNSQPLLAHPISLSLSLLHSTTYQNSPPCQHPNYCSRPAAAAGFPRPSCYHHRCCRPWLVRRLVRGCSWL